MEEDEKFKYICPNCHEHQYNIYCKDTIGSNTFIRCVACLCKWSYSPYSKRITYECVESSENYNTLPLNEPKYEEFFPDLRTKKVNKTGLDSGFVQIKEDNNEIK